MILLTFYIVDIVDIVNIVNIVGIVMARFGYPDR